MLVGIDLQLSRGTATGVGEYARGLYETLRARAALEVTALRSTRFDPWRFDRRVLWDQAALPLAAARARVDLLHCTSGTMPAIRSMPAVVTVHDVAWLRVQAHARAYARAYFGAFSLATYRGARAIFVDSEFSRGELLAVAPALASVPIVVAYPGVAAEFAALERRPDDVAPFALAVGTVEARKNLEVAVRALARVPPLRLVSVGPPTPYLERCRAIARDLGVADRFDVRGYVSREALLDLYARAAVAVVPSRYEGFGYGAAQALCASVPLLAARTSSLPEVVGDAAALLDPGDVAQWAEALTAVLAAPSEARARASAARAAAVERFSWDATAAIARAVYTRALT